MPPSKNWNPEEKRKKILDAAAAVLDRKQFHDCPVDEITRRAGIAKGTFYLYFKSKEDLYFAVFQDLLDQAKRIVAETGRTGGPAAERLAILLERITGFLEARRQIFRALMHEIGPAKGKRHDELHGRFEELVTAISAIIEDGMRAKEFKSYPPRVAGTVFLSLVSILVKQQIRPESAEERIPPAILFNLFINGLGK